VEDPVEAERPRLSVKPTRLELRGEDASDSGLRGGYRQTAILRFTVDEAKFGNNSTVVDEPTGSSAQAALGPFSSKTNH
jgi:hypothetical protein